MTSWHTAAALRALAGEDTRTLVDFRGAVTGGVADLSTPTIATRRPAACAAGGAGTCAAARTTR